MQSELGRRHGDLELAIFRAFAKVAPLKIAASSIEKLSQSEPDIRCSVEGDGPVEFELVELLDQGHAQRVSAQLQLSKYFSDCYYKASDDLRARLQSRLSNACVVLAFTRDSTMRARRQSAGRVLAGLCAIDPAFEGDLSPSELDLPERTAIRRVSILRGGFAGPRFEYPTAGSLADPAVESIGTKFSKRYNSKSPLELLAYYYRQPQTTSPRLPPDLPAYIEAHLPTSQFRRVWIFSVVSGVLAVFPDSFHARDGA